MLMPTRLNQNGKKTILLATNQSQSVLMEVSQGDVNRLAYTAYGHLSAARLPSTHLGFNGEIGEPYIRWYLLGNGYRVYNPVLMRFHSSDKWSPFGAGGLNSYMYSAADPVNYRDPTGRFTVPIMLSQLVSAAGGTSAFGGLGLSLSNSGRFSGQGVSALGSGAAGVLLGAAAFANPASVLAPVLASASVAAGAASMTLAYRAARAATARGTQWFQSAARVFDSPPRYSTLSSVEPPSFSSLNLSPPPPYSPPRIRTTIVPTHSNAPSSNGRLMRSTGAKKVQESLLPRRELFTVQMSELPQLQIIDETASAANKIRKTKN
ncbi:hypothetical protein PS662_04440 [Pseudomonas fluorescens]|uniref:RHS repeat-associated core domain-containing protein n=1 Tax=Pseudomonas fluorescens TaxID=294 RepID=A0A5E6W1H5_PSEFL|nr:RHS repeat-associated core domain-containing protein [Pseudomonas fluorescens]VVN22509.1 hypothetical protein PS662_04440 [Pseudomonas fluorescens]